MCPALRLTCSLSAACMVSSVVWPTTAVIVVVVLLVLYIRLNDRRFNKVPERLGSLLDLTAEAVQASANEFSSKPPKDVKSQLPPRTGRRYIVVGGGGFLGGWIVHQLLERGEDPANIRVLDLNMTPANHVVSDAMEHGLQYLITDITSISSVENGFNHPWDHTSPSKGISVFHTAATIRYFENHPTLLSRSSRVNVDGLQNVLDVSKKAGVDVFVLTSSSSVLIKSTRMLLWPWESEPKDFIQVGSDETPPPNTHWEHFSNYAVTKSVGEKLVRDADGSPIDRGRRRMRTGTIRPGNAVFGSRGDTFLGSYLVKRTGSPTWTSKIMHSLVYVENVALAHLLYERRLLDLIEQEENIVQVEKRLPDIGGQAFLITDPGPPLAYADVYSILDTLTKGECKFTPVSATTLFFISHIIGFYYLNQHRLISYLSSTPLLSFLHPIAMSLPTLKGDLLNLQPSLFNVSCVHLILDDSRARLDPEKGGLGYEGVWTTREGLHQMVLEEYTNRIK